MDDDARFIGFEEGFDGKPCCFDGMLNVYLYSLVTLAFCIVPEM